MSRRGFENQQRCIGHRHLASATINGKATTCIVLQAVSHCIARIHRVDVADNGFVNSILCRIESRRLYGDRSVVVSGEGDCDLSRARVAGSILNRISEDVLESRVRTGQWQQRNPAVVHRIGVGAIGSDVQTAIHTSNRSAHRTGCRATSSRGNSDDRQTCAGIIGDHITCWVRSAFDCRNVVGPGRC